MRVDRWYYHYHQGWVQSSQELTIAVAPEDTLMLLKKRVEDLTLVASHRFEVECDGKVINGAGDNQKSLKALGIPSTGEVTIRTLPEKSCFTPVYSDTAKPKVLNPHSVGYKTLERESKGWGSDIGFVGDSVNGMVEVNIQGPEKTPFAGFTIVCHIEVNQNYPFEPPHLSVATPIQHPNIDAAGKVFGLRFSEENGFDDTGDARVGPAQWHSSFTVEKLVRIMIKTLKNPNLQDYFADPKAWNSLEQDSAQEFMQAQQVNTGEE